MNIEQQNIDQFERKIDHLRWCIDNIVDFLNNMAFSCGYDGRLDRYLTSLKSQDN